MFFRVLTVALLSALLAGSAFPQSTNVTVQPDLRLFTMMAALNAAGFDVEVASRQYHPVREIVRTYAKDVDPELIARMKSFYATRKGSQTDESQLAKYISLAVNLNGAPSFTPVTREESLPPDARSVIGFLEMMREFYLKARVSQHWTEVRPEYEKAMERIAPGVREAIVYTDAYMRAPLGGTSQRTMSIYLELAAPINTVNLRSNQDSYFVVLGDSAMPKADDIRHAYLHFQLDTLVTTNISRVQNAAQLLNLVKQAQGVDPAYTSEFHIMAAESLIRAIELRIDRMPAARAKESVDGFYRSGLLLAPYFYNALDSYEKGDSGFRESFVEMMRGVQFKAEQARFQETFYKIPVVQKAVSRPEVPEPPPVPVVDPMRELLREAETAFNAGDLAKAQAAFEKTLSDFDRESGSAMYGLALIASRKGNSEEARQYFEKTLRSGSAEPSMKVWSYIYLARIFDLECNRPRALEYYQQAVKVGDDTRKAQSVAKEGIQKAFGGDACK